MQELWVEGRTGVWDWKDGGVKWTLTPYAHVWSHYRSDPAPCSEREKLGCI